MSTQTRKEREKTQRRNQIVNAAQKRFFQKGYEDVSMDEIAQDLELSKPTLYLYFQNKDALFLEVVVHGLEDFVAEFKDATAAAKTGKEKTLAFISTFFKFCRKNPDYYRLLIEARTLIVRTHKIDPQSVPIARRFGELALENMNIIKSSIQLGVEDGTLRSDLEPLQTAIFLGISCESAFQISPDYEYLLKANNISFDQYFQNSVEVMMRGIAKPK
jgi:TetR/AcrR family transcriptional regulator